MNVFQANALRSYRKTLPVRLHLPTLKWLIIDSVTKIQNQGKEVEIHL